MKREDKGRAGFVGVKRSRKTRVDQLSEAARRRLPELPASMRREADEAIERHKLRAASPGARVYVRGDGSHFIDAPHRDLDAWEVQICEAFGTRSHATMWTFLDQIGKLCRTRRRTDGDTGEFRAWVPDEFELNFMLATISAEKPDTPLQAAMLAQMVANHMMQMRVGADILGLGGDYIPPDRAATFAKLTNAFANQAEVYMKLRGKAPKAQSVTVTYRKEVHMHHHTHRHAHAHLPGGGEDQFAEQPLDASEPTYARNQTGPDCLPSSEPKSRPALPGPHEAGNVLPMRRPEEPDPVPTPRRTITRRRRRVSATARTGRATSPARPSLSGRKPLAC